MIVAELIVYFVNVNCDAFLKALRRIAIIPNGGKMSFRVLNTTAMLYIPAGNASAPGALLHAPLA